MKNWTRRHTLIGGIALILLTNAVALLGVYWNRSGEPESTLKLTQRELQSPYGWVMNRENSGILLRINWRIPSPDEYWPSSYYRGNPVWLDQAKMADLGFDVSPPAGMQDNLRRSTRQLGKEVLLVLEQDGPSYQQALQRARQNAAEQDAKFAALPDDKQMKDSAKRAHDEVRMEEQENSRLFAIDAGLSLVELRAKYPDRSRYAIVHAQIRTWSMGGIRGYIERINIDEINVPYEHHAAFDAKIRQAIGQPPSRQPFEARVAFGQRLEPWLIGVSAGEK